MRQKDLEQERNQMAVPLAVFLASYNESIPEGFPRASAEALRRFQTAYPVLFRKGDAWSIDKHRKRLMDWLASHRGEA